MKTYNQYLAEDFNELSTMPDYKYQPKTKVELENILKKEIDKQGPEADLNCIDTSLIDNMYDLFNTSSHRYAKDFNGDISKWNVSNVTNMNWMFYGCEKFNCDLSKWNVSNVVYSANMFNKCSIREEYKPKFK